jgi:8-oxo-dGTP pyrophosphatase MutT (NUDIX family)
MKARVYVAAGTVVFDDAGRVLVLDRPSRGEVRLPKGHIEDGEDARTAALRETTEEAGYDDLDVAGDLGTQVVTFTYEGETITRTERYFACRLRSDRRVPRSGKDERQFEVGWLPPAAALAALSFEAEREWVRRALTAGATLGANGPLPACPR